MPIIEPADLTLPITQGDVLQGVSLSITRDSWTEAGGEPRKTAHKLCLIVSRPCVVGHKPNIVVAAVEKMADNVPREVQTFEDIHDFLTDLRDGADSPDVFYLGQIPGIEGRFGARLDSLHTVQIPKELADQRAFTEQKRIGRLNIDFVRDLHSRIFRAFATLGFDDHRWMSSHDLRWLVSRGRQEALDARSAVESARTAQLAAEAQGYRNENEKRQLEKAVSDAQRRLEEITARLAPYDAELQAREGAIPQQPSPSRSP